MIYQNKTNSNTQGIPSIPQDYHPKSRFWLRLKRKILRHVWFVRTGLLLGIVAGVGLSFLILGFVLGRLGIPNYIHLLGDFIFTPQAQIKQQVGRTNLLILGKAGAGHTAPDLTDTVIFASVSHQEPSVVTVSLPRDIWVPAIRAKLNSAYYWGGERQPGGGIILAKSIVEEIVGEHIHYALVIDFSGFKGIVDVLGGINVDVERAFIDEKYPIPGKENDNCEGDKEYKCRYETIRFEKGIQNMNGETALKFVRSRNAEGEEGTDLARAVRQQKALVAIKNKVLTPKVFLSPKKVTGILRVVRASVETDIDLSAGAILVRRIFEARENLASYVLSEEFLIHPPISPRYDNQYVFIPKGEGWDKVHVWISCLFKINCLEGR